MFHSEPELEQVEHLGEVCQFRDRALRTREDLQEFLPQILQVILDSLCVHLLFEVLENLLVLALVKPYPPAFGADVHPDGEVTIADGGHPLAILGAGETTLPSGKKLLLIFPKVQVDPSIVPPALLVLEEPQLVGVIPCAAALVTSVDLDRFDLDPTDGGCTLGTLHGEDSSRNAESLPAGSIASLRQPR